LSHIAFSWLWAHWLDRAAHQDAANLNSKQSPSIDGFQLLSTGKRKSNPGMQSACLTLVAFEEMAF